MSALSASIREHANFFRAYPEGLRLDAGQVQRTLQILDGFAADAETLEAKVALHALKAKRRAADAGDGVVVPLRRPGAA